MDQVLGPSTNFITSSDHHRSTESNFSPVDSFFLVQQFHKLQFHKSQFHNYYIVLTKLLEHINCNEFATFFK